MSYEYSDRIILSGELMKYRKHLCEEIAKCSECNKCPAYIKEANKCALSLVIELAKYGKWRADKGGKSNAGGKYQRKREE